MTIVLPYAGDFSTGNNSQWESTGTNLGSVAVVSSYSGATMPGGNSGSYAGHSTLNTGGSTRAEWASNYSYADFHQLTKYWTFSFWLDPAQNWSTLSTNIQLGQFMTRNLQGASFHPTLRYSGWQGTSALSVSATATGGFCTPGATPSSAHYLLVNETLNSGWNTLVTPGTYRSAERFPQITGPNVYSTGGNIPVTTGVWHQYIVAITCYTDVASGKWTVYYRLKGSGPTWTTVLDTSAQWKTVQYNASQGQPTTSSGANNTQRHGAYDDQGVPGTFHLLFGNFSIQNTLVAAQAVFPAETPPSPPPGRADGPSATLKINV